MRSLLILLSILTTIAQASRHWTGFSKSSNVSPSNMYNANRLPSKIKSGIDQIVLRSDIDAGSYRYPGSGDIPITSSEEQRGEVQALSSSGSNLKVESAAKAGSWFRPLERDHSIRLKKILAIRGGEEVITFRGGGETGLKSGSGLGEVAASLVKGPRREMKAFFSSPLEAVLLRATRPNTRPLEARHVKRLLVVSRRLNGHSDIEGADLPAVIISKLWKKVREGDWRTTAKALQVLHRLLRSSDSAACTALARHHLKFLEKAKETEGGWEAYLQNIGGKHGAWLKVYSECVTSRCSTLQPALESLSSIGNITSRRHLQRAFQQTNSFFTKGLSLNFATAGADTTPLQLQCRDLVFAGVADVITSIAKSPAPAIQISNVDEALAAECATFCNLAAVIQSVHVEKGMPAPPSPPQWLVEMAQKKDELETTQNMQSTNESETVTTSI